MKPFQGTNQDDSFNGRRHRDIAYGQGGNDLLAGGGGSDLLDGGAADDTLYAAARSPDWTEPTIGRPYLPPLLDVGAEQDRLYGGEGDDLIFGGYGDTIDGGVGVDGLLISFAGASWGLTIDVDAIESGDTVMIGSTTISGIDQLEWLEGTAFADIISNADGQGPIFGLGGDDMITSAASYPSTIFGGDGNDVVDLGKSAGSFVHGDAGDDVLVGGGNAYLYGDDGDDSISVAGDGRGYNVLAGGAGADDLTGSPGSDSLTSDIPGREDNGVEHDRLRAGGGNDDLSAGYGDDVDGGKGADGLYLSLGGAAQGVSLDIAKLEGSHPFHLGGGTIQDIEQVYTVAGTNFADVIRGSTSGAFEISGGGGDDRIIGGSTAETIDGGTGHDAVSGGAGADTFRFVSGDFGNDPTSSDRILDFSHADGDKIDLSSVDANVSTLSEEHFIFIGTGTFDHQAGELRYVIKGDTALIKGDTNGDGLADFTIHLDNVTALDRSDFVL